MYFKNWIALVGMLCLPSFAEEIVDNSTVEQFTITPIVCVVQNVGDSCTMVVNVRWQATAPISSCLFQGEQRLHCWKNQTRVQQNIEISLKNNIDFTLVNDKNQILAVKNVLINTVNPKQFRRRLRADWSLF